MKVDVTKLKGSKLVIVDSNAVANSYYYGMKHLSYKVNGESVKTGAIFGLLSVLKTTKFCADYIYCFDEGGNIRKDMYEGYKSNRGDGKGEGRQGVFAQMKAARDILNVSDITTLSCKGIEADDFVVALHKKFRDKYDNIIVYTNDYDLSQVVDEKTVVKMVNSKMSDINMKNYEDVLEIPYNTILLSKILNGCSSDMVKGAKGRGNKATRFLIYNMAAKGVDFTNVRKENRELEMIAQMDLADDEVEQAKKSFEVVAPLDIDSLIDFDSVGEINKSALANGLEIYGMKSIIKVMREQM